MGSIKLRGLGFPLRYIEKAGQIAMDDFQMNLIVSPQKDLVFLNYTWMSTLKLS
jgi:hypothetical protein